MWQIPGETRSLPRNLTRSPHQGVARLPPRKVIPGSFFCFLKPLFYFSAFGFALMASYFILLVQNKVTKQKDTPISRAHRKHGHTLVTPDR
jgi:hypothetical protein